MFETVLEGLVERGLLEPVESAWLLGRRAAGDPTISAVYEAMGVRTFGTEVKFFFFATRGWVGGYEI